MQVFISWSGDRSRRLAKVLADWLRPIVQHASPWMSDANLDAGKRWNEELARRLSESNFGVACVTPENTTSPWLLFEAGALAKSLEKGRLVPLLLDMAHTDLPPPLSQFQAVEADKNGLQQLVLAITKALPDSPLSEETAKQAFESAWPRLEAQLNSLPECHTKPESRDAETILGEVLAIARRLDQASAEVDRPTMRTHASDILAWLKRELLDTEEDLVRHASIIQFYNSSRGAGGVTPPHLEDQDRVLRYRRQFLMQALTAMTALEQNDHIE